MDDNVLHYGNGGYVDIGHEKHLWMYKLQEALTIPCILLGVAGFSGLAWLIAGISPILCVLYGVALGYGVSKLGPRHWLRIVFIGLILIALWCALLEKLNIIWGIKEDTWNYLKQEELCDTY